MKLKLPIILAIYFIGLSYLLLPTPEVPDLSQAERSDEPGDTWQHPDQKGFYTNSNREQVLSEMQSKFSLTLFGFKLPSYRLNYRPEESFSLVRDQLSSYYLEEIVYPFHSSLFVNGWEPTHSPRYAGKDEKEIPQISFRGVPFISKVTLKPTSSSPWARVLVWTLVFPSIYLLGKSVKKTITSNA